MTKTLKYTINVLAFALALTVNIARGQSQSSAGGHSESTGPDLSITNLLARAQSHRRTGFSLAPGSSAVATGRSGFGIGLMVSGPNLQVLGGGTVGRLTKWTGFTFSNSFIGDTTIFEDKSGNVGIGTDTPTSKLTVAGTIESLSGGFKFPDGTLQTTAGIAPGQVVRSLNGLMGDVTLAAGTNITITPASHTLTIAAPNALTTIAHDATLTGNGTSGMPLGVALPLILKGSGGLDGVIQATNQIAGGDGLLAVGSDATSTFGGGTGVHGVGGSGDHGGDGMFAVGGHSISQAGGFGLIAGGGSSETRSGGYGIESFGGGGSGGGQGGGHR